MKKPKKPAAPIYAVAAVWLAWVFGLPLYAWWHYAALILLSIVVYGVVKTLCNGRENATTKSQEQPRPQQQKQQESPKTQAWQQTAPEPPKRKSTGNPEIDKLLVEKDRALMEMRRLNENIRDENLSRQIDDMENTTAKILDHVALHPEKLSQIQKFLNYYLPTAIKLLNTYDRMGAEGVSGENIDNTMVRVENVMSTIVTAFHKQLDGLYGAEAMDISTDIKVLETMLAREGLTDDPMANAPFSSVSAGNTTGAAAAAKSAAAATATAPMGNTATSSGVTMTSAEGITLTTDPTGKGE